MVQSWGEHTRAVGGTHGVEDDSGASLQVRAAHCSDVGCIRTRNEDYIWLDTSTGVYLVADGLGGRAAGHIASRLAATSIGEHLAAWVATHANASVHGVLTEALEAASRRVRAAARMSGRWQGMGTTMIVALVQAGVASICHAGDTRAYLVRDEQMHHLTTDDSVVTTLVADGTLAATEAHAHPQRHYVTKMLGQDGLVAPSFTRVVLAPGDWLLLCSDGLWGQVSDDTILAILRQSNGNQTRAVEALVQAANDAGGEDNVSVVLMRVEGGASSGSA